MKKLTLILLALCIVLSTASMVACGDKEIREDFEETLDIPTLLPEETIIIPDEEAEDETSNAYINAAPANDEPGWGALTPRPGK